jgi:hypothetical protein
LIESVDAGQNWRALSLAGSADFHSLETKHGLVFSYDSQNRQFMVSTDRQNWDRRAQVAMADFAVSPANPNVVLATTQQGPVRSGDGGRTFTAIPGAPILVLLDWQTTDTLVAAGPDGTIRLSKDGGATWNQQGKAPGAPQALITNGPSNVYIATASGIPSSRDGGLPSLCGRRWPEPPHPRNRGGVRHRAPSAGNVAISPDEPYKPQTSAAAPKPLSRSTRTRDRPLARTSGVPSSRRTRSSRSAPHSAAACIATEDGVPPANPASRARTSGRLPTTLSVAWSAASSRSVRNAVSSLGASTVGKHLRAHFGQQEPQRIPAPYVFGFVCHHRDEVL